MAKQRKVIKVYNKETRKWEDKVEYVEVQPKEKKDKTPSSTPTPSKTGSTMTTPTTDPKTAAGKAAKKKNKTEYYTLSGNLKLLPNEDTIKLKPNNVVKLKNLGQYLSGKYYIASVTRTIDNNGYAQELELYKPNFRQQFKEKKKTDNSKTKKKSKTTGRVKSNNAKSRGVALRSVESEGVNLASTEAEVSTKGLRIHTISSASETLWVLAKRYYNDSTKWKDIYILNNGEKPDPLNLKIGMKLVIP